MIDDNQKRLARDRWESQSKILFSIMGHMYGMPTTLATLAATLLVVATFNDQLIPLTNLVRFLIALLLLCIPFLLWPLHLVLKDDLYKVNKKMEEILESIEIKNDNATPQFNLVSKWFALSPYIAEAIITIVIFVICGLILKDHVSIVFK